jgi:hypothetical protein
LLLCAVSTHYIQVCVVLRGISLKEGVGVQSVERARYEMVSGVIRLLLWAGNSPVSGNVKTESCYTSILPWLCDQLRAGTTSFRPHNFNATALNTHSRIQLEIALEGCTAQLLTSQPLDKEGRNSFTLSENRSNNDSHDGLR